MVQHSTLGRYFGFKFMFSNGYNIYNRHVAIINILYKKTNGWKEERKKTSSLISIGKI